MQSEHDSPTLRFSNLACRNITLVPISRGLGLPGFYRPLLQPYTLHQVCPRRCSSPRGQPLLRCVGLYFGSQNTQCTRALCNI